jgi:hypothetical protein
MTQQRQLALGIKNLLDAVSGQSTDHLTEVDTDLLQTSLLITEAIEKLAASFLAIHAAVTTQQGIVDSLLADGTTEGTTHENARIQIDALRADIGRHVNAAITGLQFQDMTSQLIDRSRNRIFGLHESLTVLRECAVQIKERTAPGELVTQLDQTREAVSRHSSKLDGALRKSVSQTHLESGDIELF